MIINNEIRHVCTRRYLSSIREALFCDPRVTKINELGKESFVNKDYNVVQQQLNQWSWTFAHNENLRIALKNVIDHNNQREFSFFLEKIKFNEIDEISKECTSLTDMFLKGSRVSILRYSPSNELDFIYFRLYLDKQILAVVQLEGRQSNQSQTISFINGSKKLAILTAEEKTHNFMPLIQLLTGSSLPELNFRSQRDFEGS